MALVDQYGQPIDLGLLAEPQTADTAWLVREFDTHPAKGLTPSRLANILQAAEQGDWIGQLDLADDMEERDGHLYAELGKRKGSIAALDGDVVEPVGATAQEKVWTALMREWLGAIPDFEDVLLEMMDGVLKGSGCHELVWQQEGRVRVPQLTFTPQRWFVPDATRKGLLLRSATNMAPPPKGMEGLAPVMGEPLRPLAWMVHIPRARNGYLARSSLVRVLGFPYLFKHYGVRDLAELLEICGLPLRLGQYPAGASAEEKLTLLRAVTDIGHNAAGIIPQGMKIDFQQAAQGTQVPFMAMIQYMDAVQSKVILGQTLSASEGQNGTQALGTVHEKVRMDIRATDARQIEGTLTRQLLVPMGLINIPGFDPRRTPRFKLDLGESEDVKAYADALPGLARAGMRIQVAWAHEKLRIPMAKDGEPILEVESPSGDAKHQGDKTGDHGGDSGDGGDGNSGPKPGKASGKKAALSGALPAAPTRDAIDEMVDDAIGDWRPLLEPLTDPLMAALSTAIERGDDIATFRAALPELLAGMDHRAMAERLAGPAFRSRLAGEADLGLSDAEA